MYNKAENVKKQIERMPEDQLIDLTNRLLKKIGKSHRKIRPNHASILIGMFNTVEGAVTAMTDTDKYRTIDKYVYWHPRGVLNSSNSAYESMNSVLGIERMVMAMFKYPKVARCFGIEMGEQNGSL